MPHPNRNCFMLSGTLYTSTYPTPLPSPPPPPVIVISPPGSSYLTTDPSQQTQAALDAFFAASETQHQQRQQQQYRTQQRATSTPMSDAAQRYVEKRVLRRECRSEVVGGMSKRNGVVGWQQLWG